MLRNQFHSSIISPDQILIVLSDEPEYIVKASSEIAIELTHLECPSRTLTHSPVAPCKILIVLSSEPENIIETSAEIAIDITESVCPLRTLTHSPVAVRQILIVLSVRRGIR